MIPDTLPRLFGKYFHPHTNIVEKKFLFTYRQHINKPRGDTHKNTVNNNESNETFDKCANKES